MYLRTMGYLGIIVAVLCLTSWPVAAQDDDADIWTDVVVVGTGAAGLSAALQASEAGAEVILLEKLAFTGGTTRLSAGGMCAANLDLQLEHGIEDDSPEQHAQDMLELGQHKNDPALVEVVAENAAEAIDWIRGHGVELQDRVISAYDVTYPRIYFTDGGGNALVDRLTEAAVEHGVDLWLESKGTELQTDGSGSVTGVAVTDVNGEKTVIAVNHGVVLATGGFARNQDLVQEFTPHLEGVATNKAAGATGSGIEMARAIGADVVDMDLMRVQPLGSQVNGRWTTAPADLVDYGGVFINKHGEDIGAEDKEGDDLAAAILAQDGHTAYLAFDRQIYEQVGSDALGAFIDADALIEGTCSETAEAVGAAPALWEASLVDAGLDTEHVFAVEIRPYVHTTMGGLRINPEAEVLDSEGNAIPGLFAAGEVTGGVHGADQGNAISDCLVFGRVAGKHVTLR